MVQFTIMVCVVKADCGDCLAGHHRTTETLYCRYCTVSMLEFLNREDGDGIN